MKKPSWISEFKEFIMRGNVLDMAVGVVIGAAFTAIVNAIAARVAAAYDKEGLLPPVYSSANVDRGGEYNRKVYETYRDQICYEMV